jgi:hypothetical protein
MLTALIVAAEVALWLRRLGRLGTADGRLDRRPVRDPARRRLERTWALVNVAVLWTVVLAVDFLISFSYTLSPRRAKAA